MKHFFLLFMACILAMFTAQSARAQALSLDELLVLKSIKDPAAVRTALKQKGFVYYNKNYDDDRHATCENWYCKKDAAGFADAKSFIKFFCTDRNVCIFYASGDKHTYEAIAASIKARKIPMVREDNDRGLRRYEQGSIAIVTNTGHPGLYCVDVSDNTD